MTLEEAIKLGKLWASGKMIGGDAYDAAAVLSAQIEEFQKEREYLRTCLEIIEMRASSQGPGDELKDVLRDLWHIHSAALSAIAKLNSRKAKT